MKLKVTIKTALLDYMSGNPGVGLSRTTMEKCTAVLREFVAGTHFDVSAVCKRDIAYTRISIVMPSYNKAPFIERAILSVLNQNYPNLQFIIMDGGSTDGTLDVIRKYEKYLYWRSEPDRGQSDAINKAIRLADGELVGWQNSDDVYFPGAFHRVHERARRRPRAVLYSGSVAHIDRNDRLISVPRYVRPTVPRLLYGGYVLSSQGVFVRRVVQSRVEFYDPELYSAMDLDVWLKLLDQGPAEFLPELVGALRLYESTKTSLAPERGHAEVSAIRKKYGVDDTTFGWRVKRNLQFLSCVLERGFAIRRHCVTIPPNN